MTAAALESLTPARLATILKTVPAKKFRITELAPQLLTGGKVDIEKCMARQMEVDLAVTEIRSYIDSVNSLRHAISYYGRYEAEPMEEEDFANDEYDPDTDLTRDMDYL